MKDKLLELLYRSFDDELTVQEADELAEALNRSEELRAERERIAEMRRALGSVNEDFGPFFAERVMNRLEARPAENGLENLFQSLLLSFRRVALAGAIVAVGLLSYNLISTGDLSLNGAFAATETTLEDVLQSPLATTLENIQ